MTTLGRAGIDGIREQMFWRASRSGAAGKQTFSEQKMMRNPEQSQNTEPPGLAFVESTCEQVTRIAFSPIHETVSTAPVHAACSEFSPIEKVMLLAFEDRQTTDIPEADVLPAPVPVSPPTPAIPAPDLHSELAPAVRPGWILATVALVVAALVVGGFALISLLRVGQAPSVAGPTLKPDLVSGAPTIPTVPPVILPVSRPSAAIPTTDSPAGNSDAAVSHPPTEAKPVARRATNIAPPLTGTVRLVIKPWGHVLVDGVAVGVTPPLKRLTLPQGQHKVQVVNPGFATYLALIEVSKDDSVTVTYEFK